MKNQQIVRFDGKNVFVEVLNSMIDKGKLVLNFVQYDTSQDTGGRQKENLNFFIDLDDFLVLAQDIKSGKLAKMRELEKQIAKKADSKYCKHVYSLLGGVSATNLAKRSQERSDKMSLSRQFKLTPGSTQPWMLSCEHGPGEEDDKGLIVPKGRPESIVRVALTDDSLKKLAIAVELQIQAYYSGMYATGEAFASYNDNEVMADYYVKKAERLPIIFNINKAKTALYSLNNGDVKTTFQKRVDALIK